MSLKISRYSGRIEYSFASVHSVSDGACIGCLIGFRIGCRFGFGLSCGDTFCIFIGVCVVLPRVERVTKRDTIGCPIDRLTGRRTVLCFVFVLRLILFFFFAC